MSFCKEGNNWSAPGAHGSPSHSISEGQIIIGGSEEKMKGCVFLTVLLALCGRAPG